MGIQAKAVGGVALTGVMALLSLGMIGILVTLVVNLGRLTTFTYTSLPDFPVSESTLKALKILNGALLVIPLVIFVMCAYDIGKLVANPTKAATEKVMAAASGKQGPVKKRPILFGSLFFVLSGAVIGARGGVWEHGSVLCCRTSACRLSTPGRKTRHAQKGCSVHDRRARAYHGLLHRSHLQGHQGQEEEVGVIFPGV